MNNESDTSSIILVVEDVNEIRGVIEKLLKADGTLYTGPGPKKTRSPNDSLPI